MCNHLNSKNVDFFCFSLTLYKIDDGSKWLYMKFCLEKQRPGTDLGLPLDSTLDNGLSLSFIFMERVEGSGLSVQS